MTAMKTICVTDANNNDASADTTMKRGGTKTAKKTMCADALITNTTSDLERVGMPPTETSNMVPEHKKSKKLDVIITTPKSSTSKPTVECAGNADVLI